MCAATRCLHASLRFVPQLPLPRMPRRSRHSRHRSLTVSRRKHLPLSRAMRRPVRNGLSPSSAGISKMPARLEPSTSGPSRSGSGGTHSAPSASRRRAPISTSPGSMPTSCCCRDCACWRTHACCFRQADGASLPRARSFSRCCRARTAAHDGARHRARQRPQSPYATSAACASWASRTSQRWSRPSRTHQARQTLHPKPLPPSPSGCASMGASCGPSRPICLKPAANRRKPRPWCARHAPRSSAGWRHADRQSACSLLAPTRRARPRLRPPILFAGRRQSR